MNKPNGRKQNLVIQELDNEILIYDLDKNKAYCLNETSSLVWRLCDGSNSITDISQEIGKQLNIEANEDLVWLAIDQLKKEKLIANGDELTSKFEGISRREAIKKVGLATMIALPVVTGLTAPTAAFAQSVMGGGGLPAGSPVTAMNSNNGQCMNALTAQCSSGTISGYNYNSATNTCTGTCT